MFLSLSIAYREFRYQIGFHVLELPLPVVRNALQGPNEVPREGDILVPVSALLDILRPYQCPHQGFLKQVFSGPATSSPPETPNVEGCELPEPQQLCRG